MKCFQEKINLFSGLTLLFFSIFAVAAAAQEDLQDGLSGRIFIGAAYSDRDLSLEDASDDANKTLQNLNQSQKNESDFAPFIIGEVNYHFASTGTTISAGDHEDGFGLSLTQEIGNPGSLTINGFYQEIDVYSDPFATGTARAVTDRETQGLTLSWNNIFGSGFMAGYTHESVDVDNDVAGKRNAALKREGNIHRLNLAGTVLENGNHEIGASVGYVIGNLSGAAYSYDGYQIGVSHVLRTGLWELETGLTLSYRDYDAVHPEFNKTRNETQWELGTVYTLHDPLGFKNYFVSLFGSYSNNNANINFYDASDFTAGAGIGYHF